MNLSNGKRKAVSDTAAAVQTHGAIVCYTGNVLLQMYKRSLVYSCKRQPRLVVFLSPMLDIPAIRSESMPSIVARKRGMRGLSVTLSPRVTPNALKATQFHAN